MKQILYILISFLLVGCKVGPNFKSPVVDIPQAFIYDSLPTDTSVYKSSSRWWMSFEDKNLDTLITKALAANKDIKIAQLSLEASKLRYKNSRAAAAPSLSIGGEASGKYSNTSKIVQSYTVMPQMSWEIDLFGGLARAKEGAMAKSLSEAATYNATVLSVVSQMAQNYFSLLEYKVSLEISLKSYETRRKSFELMSKMFEYGSISLVSLNQSRTLMLSASIAADGYRNAISEVSAAISVLMGENPQKFDYINGAALFNMKTPSLPPSIVPAWVIENRPDIMAAYYDIWVSSAAIGVAVSRRFPTIGLSAGGGVIYNIAEGVTTPMPWVWNGSLSIAQSLLNFGTNKRNVDIARLENQQTIISFEKVVITAFGEVESAISQISNYTKQEREYMELVNTTESINNMTTELYAKGVIDFLQVLDADRDLFDAQIEYATTISQKLTGYVSLYKATGGSF